MFTWTAWKSTLQTEFSTSKSRREFWAEHHKESLNVWLTCTTPTNCERVGVYLLLKKYDQPKKGISLPMPQRKKYFEQTDWLCACSARCNWTWEKLQHSHLMLQMTLKFIIQSVEQGFEQESYLTWNNTFIYSRSNRSCLFVTSLKLRKSFLLAVWT